MMKSIVIAHGSGYGSITASAADLRLPYSDCPNRAAKSPHGLLSSTPDASSAANVGRNSQCQPTREELPASGYPNIRDSGDVRWFHGQYRPEPNLECPPILP